MIDLLVDNNIMSSKSEARRAINNNGIKINDSMVNDEKKLIVSEDFNEEKMKISFGKKKHFLFKLI